MILFAYYLFFEVCVSSVCLQMGIESSNKDNDDDDDVKLKM